MEGLANAASSFPDTIKIESLADSLQETLATGQATGQFAEMLDRMGIGAENFSSNLSLCTTEAQKQNIALSALVSGPLHGSYDEWKKNNQGLVENREASVNLQYALSELAESVQPLLTNLTEMATKFLDWFNSLDEGTQKAIASVGALIFAISPMAGAISGISKALPGVIDLFGKLDLKTAGVGIAIMAIVWAVMQLISAWEDMSALQRVVALLGLLAAAALTAAVAVGMFTTASSMGLAAVGIVAGIATVIAAIAAAKSQADSMSNSMKIPQLASGAVIPPNAPFLAMVGDNKKENEIIAPYSTIKRAAAEGVMEGGYSKGNATAQHVTMTLDGRTFARLILPYLDGEEGRLGIQLSK